MPFTSGQRLQVLSQIGTGERLFGDLKKKISNLDEKIIREILDDSYGSRYITADLIYTDADTVDDETTIRITAKGSQFVKQKKKEQVNDFVFAVRNSIVARLDSIITSVIAAVVASIVTVLVLRFLDL